MDKSTKALRAKYGGKAMSPRSLPQYGHYAPQWDLYLGETFQGRYRTSREAQAAAERMRSAVITTFHPDGRVDRRGGPGDELEATIRPVPGTEPPL